MRTGMLWDVMFAYTAPELYEILVTDHQCLTGRYADFIFRRLVAELPHDDRPRRTIASGVDTLTVTTIVNCRHG